MSPADDPTRDTQNHDPPVTVYEATNSNQAHILCALLGDAGIEARVASDALEWVTGAVPFQLVDCPVLVRASDAERARPIVDDFQSRLEKHQHSDALFCYKCGEELSAAVSPCPHCGAALEWPSDGEAD